MTFARRTLSTTLGLLLALGGVAASAQIDEIVVTVQKREQSLQDVPVAVSAFDENFMNKMGVQDFRDLVDLTPGFNGNTQDGFIDALAIRGISTNDFGIGGDPSVAIFVNGVYEGRNGGAQTTFLDVARAEVVRGPQNTLFGRNAIAGAVSVVTNQPGEELGGKVTAGIAEFGHYQIESTVNVPITDNLFFRGTAHYTTEDGYLDNRAGGDDLGAYRSTAFQGALRWATEDLDATFTAFYEERDGLPSVYWTEFPLDPVSGRLSASGVRLDEDEVWSDLGDEGRDEAEILRLTLDVTWELGGGYSLNSLTGYKQYDYFYLEDYDASNERIDNYSQDQSVWYVSQDFRLNSPDDGAFVWFVGGGFYFEDIEADFRNTYDENSLCRAVSETDAPDFNVSPVANCFDPSFQAYYGGTWTFSPRRNKSERNVNKGEYWGWAVFADGTWHVTDDFSLTAGVRFTYDEKEARVTVFDSRGDLANNFQWEYFTDNDGDLLADEVVAEDDWSQISPRIAFNYSVSEEITLYGNAALGYKSGGFSTFGLDLSGASFGATPAGRPFVSGARPLVFDEEESTSYELGIKAVLFDNTLQANLSVYRYDYDDLQLTFFTQGSTLTANVAEARGNGAELDVRYMPFESLDIFFSAAYGSTEIEETDLGFLQAGGCDHCKGNELPFSPRFSSTTVVTWTQPLFEGEVFITAEHHYQGSMFGGVDNWSTASTDSWNEFGFQVGYDSGEEWTFTVYVENAFDEEYFERGWENADGNNQYGYGIPNTMVWPSKPQTVGARFTFDF